MCEACDSVVRGWQSVSLSDIPKRLDDQAKESLSMAGVYALWVEGRNNEPDAIHARARRLLERVSQQWPHVRKAIKNDLRTLESISTYRDCRLVYLGQASGRTDKKGMLARIKDFPGGHTAWAALLALLHDGWKFRVYFRSLENNETPDDAERRCLRQFCKVHWEQRIRGAPDWAGTLCHDHCRLLRPAMNRQAAKGYRQNTFDL